MIGTIEGSDNKKPLDSITLFLEEKDILNFEKSESISSFQIINKKTKKSVKCIITIINERGYHYPSHRNGVSFSIIYKDTIGIRENKFSKILRININKSIIKEVIFNKQWEGIIESRQIKIKKHSEFKEEYSTLKEDISNV